MSTKTLSTERFLPARFSELFKPWEEWFTNGRSLFNGEWPSFSVPAVNITENKDSYHLSLAAPGLKKEDFNLDMDGDLLTISAEKKETKEERDEKYNKKEYNYSSFSRSFTLPAEVIKDKIDAHYDNGILKITLPKTELAQKSSAKKIAVQ